MADAACKPWDLGCVVGSGVQGVVNDQIENFVKSLATGSVQVLKFLTSFWLYLPSPDVKSTAITTISNNLSWYTFAFALIGIFIALMKMTTTQQFGAGISAVKMIVNLILVTGVYTTAFAALIKASDAFAPWIIEKATGAPMDMSGMLSVDSLTAAGVGPGLLLAIAAFLGSFANVLFTILRTVMISILFAFLPTLAASSASEMGAQAFRKAQGYLLAFVLFKPIAAIIYALGFLELTHPPTISGLDDTGKAIFNVSVGMMTLLVAALALPAVIKFIVPVAAQGTSGAFSGAAVGAAAVAAGAAVVTLGAGAAAGGAASVGAAGGGGSAALASSEGGAAATAGGGTAAAVGGGGAGKVAGDAGASGGGSGAKSTDGAGGGGDAGSSSSGSGTGSSDGAAAGGSTGAGGQGTSGAGAAGGSSSGGGGGSRTPSIAETLGDLTAAGSQGAQQGMDESTEEQR